MSVSRPLSRIRNTFRPPRSQNPRICACPHHLRSYATEQPHSKPGIAGNSLLEKTARRAASASYADRQEAKDERPNEPTRPMDRDPEVMAAKIDPQPLTRRRREHRHAIQAVKRRGRLSPYEVIQRTEREGLYKSQYWKTSVKKLAPLARQLAGKTIDEALVQMNFSVKHNAAYIADFLQKAKVTAMLERGMGLVEGSDTHKQRIDAERRAAGLPPLNREPVQSKSAQDNDIDRKAAKSGSAHIAEESPAQASKDTNVDGQAERPSENSASSEPSEGREAAWQQSKDGTGASAGSADEKVNEEEEEEDEDEDEEDEGELDEQLKKHKERMQKARQPRARITLKNGNQHTVYDSTTMYIAQAWVNKGSYGQDAKKRARGRRDRLRLPTTSISVIIKEEATRVREHAQRQAKEAKKKPWLQLPNRPISEQRPYYCW